MPRLPLFDPTNMSAEQARVYNEIITAGAASSSARFGRTASPGSRGIIGSASVKHCGSHQPAAKAGRAGDPCYARRWKSRSNGHSLTGALNAGLAENVIRAIKEGQLLNFADGR